MSREANPSGLRRNQITETSGVGKPSKPRALDGKNRRSAAQRGDYTISAIDKERYETQPETTENPNTPN